MLGYSKRLKLLHYRLIMTKGTKADLNQPNLILTIWDLRELLMLSIYVSPAFLR